MKQYSIYFDGGQCVTGDVTDQQAAEIDRIIKDRIGEDEMLEIDDTDGKFAVNLKYIQAYAIINVKDKTTAGFCGSSTVQSCTEGEAGNSL